MKEITKFADKNPGTAIILGLGLISTVGFGLYKLFGNTAFSFKNGDTSFETKDNSLTIENVEAKNDIKISSDYNSKKTIKDVKTTEGKFEFFNENKVVKKEENKKLTDEEKANLGNKKN